MHSGPTRRPECDRDAFNAAIHKLPVRRNAVDGRIPGSMGVVQIHDALVPILAGHLVEVGSPDERRVALPTIEMVASARKLDESEAREPGRRALPVVQGHQFGSALIECHGDV